MTKDTIHGIFENISKRYPNKVALSFNKDFITYEELNDKSNRLAHYLLSNGVVSGDAVSICLHRSFEYIICILSVLKSGCMYVPIDPDFPNHRKRLIVNQSNSPHLITTENLGNQLDNIAENTIYLENFIGDRSKEKYGSIDIYDRNGLAYIMFTSGSTGSPKGVVIPHCAIIRLVIDTNYIKIDENDVFIQLSALSFDASTFEIWGALLNGATLDIYPNKEISISGLGKAIENKRISIMWLSAGLFHLIVDQKVSIFSKLRVLLAGGDVLHVNAVKKVINRFEKITLINGYGPTENTTFTCCYPITRGSYLKKTVPIGRAISGTTTYILDEFLKKTKIGEIGELYIGGLGLAKGYINDQEMTMEKFISNPWITGEIIYKTGDMVYQNSLGLIEFIGRRDDQFKIRGYRIECKEIESAISQDNNVADVSVLVVGDDIERKLVSFIKIVGKDRFDKQYFNEELKKIIPLYMIPNEYVLVKEMPITSNGKIDKSKLLRIYMKDYDNEIESTIANLWMESLDIQNIDVSVDLFDIGANSLMVLLNQERLHEILGVDTLTEALMEDCTISNWARIYSNK